MITPVVFSSFKSILETKALFVFGVFFILAFLSLSYFSFWTETEIYPVHSARHLWTENMTGFLFALKPVFYLFLYLSSQLSDWLSLPPMTTARFLFALNGLGILILTGLYIQKKTNKYNAILAVLLLASANIFLDRGFRARSDLLSSSVSLMALCLSLSAKNNRELWKFYLSILLLLSTLMISPKAVYWICFALCLAFYDLRAKRFVSSWPIVVTVFAAYMAFYFLSFLFKDPFFIKSIYESAKFYFSDIHQAFHFVSAHGWMKNLFEFSHIGFFIERNPLLVLLILLKACFAVFAVVISKKRKWDLSDLYFLIVMAVFLLHPKQKLFFLCALAPFVFISFFTDWQWRRLLNHSYSLKFKTFLLAGAFIYSFFYISHFSYKVYTKRNNQAQRELVENLNKFYSKADPLISIFDPACVLYSKKTDCKYILYDKKWPKALKSYLIKHNFDVILASRFLSLFDLAHYKRTVHFSRTIPSSFQYINIKSHVYYKAFVIEAENVSSLLTVNNQNPSLAGDSWDLKPSAGIRGAMSAKSPRKANSLAAEKTGAQSLIAVDVFSLPSQKPPAGIREAIGVRAVPLSKNQKQIRPIHKNKRGAIQRQKTDFLRGKIALRFLLSSLETKAPESSRKYSYLYLDSHNRPIQKAINCPQRKEGAFILTEGCPYNKEDFERGWIPLSQKKMALFYLPFPLNLPEGLSLAALFRYDMF